MNSTAQYARLKRARIHARLRRQRAVDGRPTYWPALLLAAAMWMMVVLLLHLSEGLSHSPLSEGQRAPATVIAEVDFTSVDLAATELARRQEADAVLPVFAISQTGLQSAERRIDQLFNQVIEVRASPSSPPSAATNVLELPNLQIPLNEALSLVPEGKEEVLRTAMITALRDVWSQGIISITERDSKFHGVAGSGKLSIAQTDRGIRSPVSIEELYVPDAAARAMVNAVRSETEEIQLNRQVLYRIARAFVQPNLSYDAARTEAAKLSAQNQVNQATKTVRAGATLINQGDRATPQQLQDLRAHEQRLNELQSPLDRRLQWVGRSLLVLFALVLCSGLLQIVRPDIVQAPARILLLIILSLLNILAVAGLFYLANNTDFMEASLVEFLLPLSFAPILTTILIGPATAVVVGAWTSFTAAVMFDNSFSIFAMGLLVTIIVAHIARGMRKRSRMVRIGLYVGVAQLLYGLSIAVLSQLPANLVAVQAGSALLNGLIAALLALVFLPMFESLFDITTDITLLELSDMGHPLLQRLALEAPGSYHHSLMVANLAQSAAREVGANALLVRVCAYFHDVGKLTKPEFFVENTQFRENPHDELTPSMSTLVIISHVKEGVSMARRAKLPLPLIEAIEQHHGTSVVAYFYHRAKTQKAEDENATQLHNREVAEEDYRYPGPKPQNIEMGILLLADSVEAASRSMDKPSPSRIAHLVHDIVDARLKDDQLDDCDLTFAQLKAIKRSFIFTLTNMLHGRVPYPKDENRTDQSTEAVSPAPGGPANVRPVDHESSAQP